MKEIVLLYNIDGEKAKKIKRILLLLGIRVKYVSKEYYGNKIGVLAGMIRTEEAQDAEIMVNSKKIGDIQPDIPFMEEMLVMCGFSNEKVDRFLMEMRKNKVGKIDLKAILTPYNAGWNSYELYRELKKEHLTVSSQEDKSNSL